MARTTISVPDELKTEMDKVGGVNWSALACKAFEIELGEIAKRKEKKTMNDVIQRLRASKLQSTDVDTKLGREAGEKWAMTVAEASDLEAIEAESGAFDSLGDDDDGVNVFLEIIADDPSDVVASDVRDFREQYGLKGQGNVAFMQGFAEGAMHIWDQAKSEI